MSNVAHWQQLLPTLRERYVGGEIEEHTKQSVFRGPISEITIVEDVLTISGPWCARKENDEWVRWPVTSGMYPLEHCGLPQYSDDGRLTFIAQYSHVELLPKEDSKLDPAKVRGL